MSINFKYFLKLKQEDFLSLKSTVGVEIILYESNRTEKHFIACWVLKRFVSKLTIKREEIYLLWSLVGVRITFQSNFQSEIPSIDKHV